MTAYTFLLKKKNNLYGIRKQSNIPVRCNFFMQIAEAKFAPACDMEESGWDDEWKE
jgi:hypothetical protein